MIDGEERRLDEDDLPFDEVRSGRSRGRPRLLRDGLEGADRRRGGAGGRGRPRTRVRARQGRRRGSSTAPTAPAPPVASSWAPSSNRGTSPSTPTSAPASGCDGIGSIFRADPALLVTDPTRPLADGAIGGKLGRYLVKGKGYYETLLRTVARSHRIDLEKPLREAERKASGAPLRGVGARASLRGADVQADAQLRLRPGVLVGVERPLRAHRRLAPANRRPRVGRDAGEGHGAADLSRLRRRAAGAGLPERPRRAEAAPADPLDDGRVRAGVVDRPEAAQGRRRRRSGRSRPSSVRGSHCSERVGLGYLTLDRATATLSGGEARSVRLSASLGSELVGVCYVLDEPTVGLHPRDIDRLSGALEDLRDAGNTVLVVEHDAELMARADHIVDMGPGAGVEGGAVVVSGTPRRRSRASHLPGRAVTARRDRPRRGSRPRTPRATQAERGEPAPTRRSRSLWRGR